MTRTTTTMMMTEEEDDNEGHVWQLERGQVSVIFSYF